MSFYAQMGLDPAADDEQIRAEYARLVARLAKRRRTLLDKGGDAVALDRQRTHLDEAWAVLSDPRRRRRYDAMLAAMRSEVGADELWDAVAGALVPPGADEAVRLLAAVTDLPLGQLPQAPGPKRVRVVHLADRANPTAVPFTDHGVPTEGPEYEDESEADVVPLRTGPQAVSEPGLKIVDGSKAPPVLVMPTPSVPTVEEEDPIAAPAEGPVDTEALYRRFGASGQLLREVREARGMTLQDISDTTRISVRYLQALEDETFDQLPSATFVRGYVREFVRVLEIDDATGVVQGYMRRFSG